MCRCHFIPGLMGVNGACMDAPPTVVTSCSDLDRQNPPDPARTLKSMEFEVDKLEKSNKKLRSELKIMEGGDHVAHDTPGHQVWGPERSVSMCTTQKINKLREYIYNLHMENNTLRANLLRMENEYYAARIAQDRNDPTNTRVDRPPQISLVFKVQVN